MFIMSDRSSLVASDGNNKVKVGQGSIESDWLLNFLYKFITKNVISYRFSFIMDNKING
jgi:hypothetical protein